MKKPMTDEGSNLKIKEEAKKSRDKSYKSQASRNARNRLKHQRQTQTSWNYASSKPAEKQIEAREDNNHLEGATACGGANWDWYQLYCKDKAIDEINTVARQDVPKPTFESIPC